MPAPFSPPRGIKFRVGNRQFSPDLFSPLLQQFIELFGFLRKLFTQIIAFTNIGAKPVKTAAVIVQVMDQLPVSFSDHRCRLIMVVDRVVPENSSFGIRGFSFKNRQQAFSVEFLGGGQ